VSGFESDLEWDCWSGLGSALASVVLSWASV